MSEIKPGDSPQPSRRKGLVYVVDDEPMLLELASVILEADGYSVQVFRDPLLALETFASGHSRPDVLVTDYAMDPMNGMDLIARCRQIEPGQKILLVSGTVGEDIYQDSAIKPDRFIAKPYHAAELTGIVGELMPKP